MLWFPKVTLVLQKVTVWLAFNRRSVVIFQGIAGIMATATFVRGSSMVRFAAFTQHYSNAFLIFAVWDA